MTPNGYNALRRELKRLKASRPELSRAIEVARAHGDISENADYDAAKNKSGMVEAKIRDIESKLAYAQIIDPLKIASMDKVVFGLSVKIEDLDSSESKKISLVGSDESDIDKGLISFESPLGKALIGKQLGDVVKVNLPAGSREFEIMEIFVDYVPEPEEDMQ
ncbi:MAG: transcription elongation factor GreA [Proteobacteria bacterium]|nr:MAG: transcription elongation factor GreA [Pseudomonadota bacterium]